MSAALAASAPEPVPVLRALGMTKRFGDAVVLDDVSLSLTPGSFHALLGENGAGKSTLVKCIMGFYHADAGQVMVGERVLSLKSPRDAQQSGIGMVYQHFTLVANMTVAENLVLARARVPAVIDWQREHAALDAFMQRMPFRVDPRRTVRTLAAGEKQKLEILKQLYLGSRIVILDEPTSVLTPDEADEVLGMLRGMTREGKLSVLMISHKFREVLKFCDEVTVLRRGRLAGHTRVPDTTAPALAEMMVGSTPPSPSVTRQVRAPGAEVLAIRELRADDDIGVPLLRGVSLEVRAGEIVGIAGVSGNGQDELVEVLAGQRRAQSGDVHVNGAAFRHTRAELCKQRIRLLPEAPLANACVPSMSVAENIAFRSFDVPPFTLGGWFVNRRAQRRFAERRVKEYSIKAGSVDHPIRELSGGNVQRAVLARELSGEVALLVAANPCFGLDFAAVSEIRTRIIEARNAGAAVLLVSTDLEEIFALSDRILVMSEGRIVYSAGCADATLASVGRHMAGHA